MANESPPFGGSPGSPLRPALFPDGSAPGRTDQRVLVADDDPGMRGVLELCLQRAGYAVTAVADGEAAWEAFTSGSFALLVTDHDMPRLPGLELIRRLRSFSHRLPVIFMSGSLPWHTVGLKGLLRPGITLEKPFPVTVLIAHVEALLTKTSLSFGGRQPAAKE